MVQGRSTLKGTLRVSGPQAASELVAMGTCRLLCYRELFSKITESQNFI